MYLAHLRDSSGPLSGNVAGKRSPALMSTPTPVTRGAGNPLPKAVFSSQQQANVRSISSVRRWNDAGMINGKFEFIVII